eukprot:COSAG06_NODE_414_length_16033_cov_67.366717_14_plen_117_part_00
MTYSTSYTIEFYASHRSEAKRSEAKRSEAKLSSAQLSSAQLSSAQLSSAQLSSDRVDPKSPDNVRQAQDKRKENSSAPPLFFKAVAVEVAVRASQKLETAKTGAQVFGIASTTRMA